MLLPPNLTPIFFNTHVDELSRFKFHSVLPMPSQAIAPLSVISPIVSLIAFGLSCYLILISRPSIGLVPMATQLPIIPIQPTLSSLMKRFPLRGLFFLIDHETFLVSLSAALSIILFIRFIAADIWNLVRYLTSRRQSCMRSELCLEITWVKHCLIINLAHYNAYVSSLDHTSITTPLRILVRPSILAFKVHFVFTYPNLF